MGGPLAALLIPLLVAAAGKGAQMGIKKVKKDKEKQGGQRGTISTSSVRSPISLQQELNRKKIQEQLMPEQQD